MEKKKISIFMLIGKTGAGKSFFHNKVIEDKEFCDKYNISNLVYGTTRASRDGDGSDYYYITESEYQKINHDDIVERRTYHTVDNGLIHYFTKVSDLTKGTNLICTGSPFQYEKYLDWTIRQNMTDVNNKYNLYAIFINVPVQDRLTRLINRADSDDMIYEACRRIVEERSEFEKVGKTHPQFTDPKNDIKTLVIDNYISDEEIVKGYGLLSKFIEFETKTRDNIKTIKDFIKEKIEFTFLNWAQTETFDLYAINNEE